MQPNDRREDWQHGVDENLASLNAGQRVWERELVTIRKLLADIDKLLRGDPEKDTDGLMARLHLQETEVNMLKAVVLKDKAGNRGLVARIEALESGDRTSENRWKFVTAVCVAIITLLGALLTNWERVAAAFGLRAKEAPLEKTIERDRHPKGKTIYKERVIPADNEDSE